MRVFEVVVVGLACVGFGTRVRPAGGASPSGSAGIPKSTDTDSSVASLLQADGSNHQPRTNPLKSLSMLLMALDSASAFSTAHSGPLVGFSPARFSPTLASVVDQAPLASRPQTSITPITDNDGRIVAAETWVPAIDFDGHFEGQRHMSVKYADKAMYVVQRKVVAEMAAKRLGTAVAKTRAEVRGGGRKPYQQKGTGRARRGSTRSPLIVGGGKPFGPRQKNYRQKMNRKEAQLAISTAIMNSLPHATIIPDFDNSHFQQPSTAEMREFLERAGIDTSDQNGKGHVMMITVGMNENVWLSARNIPYLQLAQLGDTYFPPVRDILKAKKLLISENALKEIEARFGWHGEADQDDALEEKSVDQDGAFGECDEDECELPPLDDDELESA